MMVSEDEDEDYHLVMTNIAMERSTIFITVGKPSINGPFSMAMLNNQRVFIKKGLIPSSSRAEVGCF